MARQGDAVGVGHPAALSGTVPGGDTDLSQRGNEAPIVAGDIKGVAGVRGAGIAGAGPPPALGDMHLGAGDLLRLEDPGGEGRSESVTPETDDPAGGVVF